MRELIVSAANKVEAGGQEFVVLGIRHYDKIMCYLRQDNLCLIEKLYGQTKEISQGFITNKGRFVDRNEGMNMAVQSGQIRRLVGFQNTTNLNSSELYSENLY